MPRREVTDGPPQRAVGGRVTAKFVPLVGHVAVAKNDDVFGGRDAAQTRTMQRLPPQNVRILRQVLRAETRRGRRGLCRASPASWMSRSWQAPLFAAGATGASAGTAASGR